MKKLLSLALLFSAFSSVAANESDAGFIDCLEKDSVSVNSTCMAQHIDTSFELEVDEAKFDAIANKQHDYAMAHMFVYPKLGLIRVVAEKPAQQQTTLVAKL